MDVRGGVGEGGKCRAVYDFVWLGLCIDGYIGLYMDGYVGHRQGS